MRNIEKRGGGIQLLDVTHLHNEHIMETWKNLQKKHYYIDFCKQTNDEKCTVFPFSVRYSVPEHLGLEFPPPALHVTFFDWINITMPPLVLLII